MTFANFAEQIVRRHFAVIENQRTGGRAADTHLVFFSADRKPRERTLHQEGGEFLAIYLREDCEQVGEAGVRDPHLLAVEDVVLAIGRKRGARAAVQRV